MAKLIVTLESKGYIQINIIEGIIILFKCCIHHPNLIY